MENNIEYLKEEAKLYEREILGLLLKVSQSFADDSCSKEQRDEVFKKIDALRDKVKDITKVLADLQGKEEYVIKEEDIKPYSLDTQVLDDFSQDIDSKNEETKELSEIENIDQNIDLQNDDADNFDTLLDNLENNEDDEDEIDLLDITDEKNIEDIEKNELDEEINEQINDEKEFTNRRRGKVRRAKRRIDETNNKISLNEFNAEDIENIKINGVSFSEEEDKKENDVEILDITAQVQTVNEQDNVNKNEELEIKDDLDKIDDIDDIDEINSLEQNDRLNEVEQTNEIEKIEKIEEVYEQEPQKPDNTSNIDSNKLIQDIEQIDKLIEEAQNINNNIIKFPKSNSVGINDSYINDYKIRHEEKENARENAYLNNANVQRHKTKSRHEIKQLDDDDDMVIEPVPVLFGNHNVQNQMIIRKKSSSFSDKIKVLIFKIKNMLGGNDEK